MREAPLPRAGLELDAATFLACVATIIELPVERLPLPREGEDPATGWKVTRWLGGLGLGLAPIANPPSFSWPGPWIARIWSPAAGSGSPGGEPSESRRSVVMYGVPSGVVWDPAAPDGAQEIDLACIDDGFLIAASDIALALPPRPSAPTAPGTLEAICVAPSAGEPVQFLTSVRTLPGRGLEGDRHVSGKGTFPSGPAGSALTLIEAEVCESFDPPLSADQHRRNLVTRGIDLGALVGHDFTIGDVRFRGMRLCEPCTVVQRYAARPVLRALVHRGGLRADILEEGEIRSGDPIRAVDSR